MNVRAVFPVIVVVLLSGCRMYGGYGSVEASISQLSEAVERLDAQTDRVRGDLDALARSAGEDAAPVVALRQVLLDHEVLLAKQAGRLDDTGTGSYRSVSRMLGAFVSEQQVVTDAYMRVVVSLVGDQGPRGGALYAVAPVYFVRLAESLNQVSVRDAIRSGS